MSVSIDSGVGPGLHRACQNEHALVTHVALAKSPRKHRLPCYGDFEGASD